MSDPILRFEDFIAWKKARELTAKIYEATERGKFQKDFGLRDQMRRASVSIMALDAQYLSSEDFSFLRSEAEEAGRVLGGLRASVQRRRDQ